MLVSTYITKVNPASQVEMAEQVRKVGKKKSVIR
jgi:hypothetical protein